MTRALNKKQLFILATTILVGILLFSLAFFSIGSRGWFGKNALTLETSFLDIRGVDVGVRVRIQGMDAGEVVGVKAPEGPGSPVILSLRIRGTFSTLLRKDAQAAIVSEGLLGGKVVEIFPGSSLSPKVENYDMIASKNSPEFGEILGQLSETLTGIKNGEGSLGKLTKDSKLYDSIVLLANQTQQTMQTFQQDADAIKRLPIVGGYIEDPLQLIVRSNAEMKRKSINCSDLFESGNAILSVEGKKILDKIPAWISTFPKDSDIVIAGLSSTGSNDKDALRILLTRQQAESVADYLKNNYSIHKIGWFSRRKVTPLGLGDKKFPGIEPTQDSESSRIELLVYINRG